MRTVQFIQFDHTTEYLSDFGYYPNINEIYRVRDLDDNFYVEQIDDEGDPYEEEYEAISIFINRASTGYRSKRSVLKDNALNFGILTIELEEDSELFT